MWKSARALLLGSLIQGLITLLVGLQAPFPGEALLQRWCRVLAEHPVRGSLALGLFWIAMQTDLGAPEPGNEPRSKRVAVAPH